MLQTDEPMKRVFEKIVELEGSPSMSKHEQLVQGIMNAIDEKIVVQNDSLPSVNVLIHEIGFARETIVKAYRELAGRGIVESKNRLGYYVANTNTGQRLRVALLMYAIDTFQEQFYKSFRKELGEGIHVDVFFHHGNMEVFETILSLVKGKYGMYAIAPIPHPKSKELLSGFPPGKFVMFDRYEPMEKESNYVVQEFEQSSYSAFVELLPAIRHFDEMIFIYQPNSLVPVEIFQSFNRFLKEHQVNGRTIPEYISGTLEPGKVYYTNDNTELFNLIKDSRQKALVLGRDVGILSHNDEPVKEILAEGITTFSTDFAEMGKRVAQFVVNQEPVHLVVPTTLHRRKSL